jgi:hypothetical protein
MSFAASPALFPDAELSSVLGAEYEAQCAQLCFGPYPSTEELLARFAALRDRL